MSPVVERYHQGVESNVSLLMPYYWIAASLLFGVIIGVLTPIFPDIINLELLIVIFGIGLFLPFIYSKIVEKLYPHEVIRKGKLIELLRNLKKTWKLKELPEVWVGNEPWIVFHHLGRWQKDLIVISKPTLKDMLRDENSCSAYLANNIIHSHPIRNGSRHLVHSTLFSLGWFLGLKQVDAVAVTLDWITRDIGIISIILLIIVVYLDERLKHSQTKRIDEFYEIDKAGASALIYADIEEPIPYPVQEARRAMLVGFTSTLVILPVFMILWEIDPWLVPFLIYQKHTVSIIIATSLSLVLILLVFPIWSFFTKSYRRRFHNRFKIHQNVEYIDIQSCIRERCGNEKIFVYKSEMDGTITIIDKEGRLFERGFYEVSASLSKILMNPEVFADYILSQACIERESQKFRMFQISGLVAIASLSASLYIWGYFRADLLVLGGDLATVLVFTSSLAFFCPIYILLRMQRDLNTVLCDISESERTSGYISGLQEIVRNGYTAYPEEETIETRISRMKKVMGENQN